MRIEAYNQVQQAYKATYTTKAEKKADVKKADDVQISSIGQDITVAKQAVKNAPDIRWDIVTPLKEKLQNGTYDVNPADFAEKMLKDNVGLF